MGRDNLDNYFESFLEDESIFQDKRYLQSNYVPGEIDHRDDQMNSIAQILAPALRNQRPSNLFVYGKTGTGKTLTCRYIAGQMRDVANKQDIPLKIIYLNCKLKKIADTEYRLIAELARMFGKDVPSTGLPTDEVYNIFFDALEDEDKVVIAILDEIDQLVRKAGDEIIYNLTRINSELPESQLSLIGISNDLMFANNLDPRVKSSLSEEEIVFPPYNAIEIQEILRERADKAFAEGVLEEGVIPKCAAYAAREHGDARRALELLRVAGELAERSNQHKILVENIDEAEHKIERDRLIDMVKTHPKQFQATLYPILEMDQEGETPLNTGDIYELYKETCEKGGLRPLTQRRISDIIGELDMLGIINAKVISKGRFGRTREIHVSLTSKIEEQLVSILQAELDINA
jgi:cell division control protein 6